MKLEQTIDIKEVARLTLKNILSSKGIIYKHYENKFKKPIAKTLIKAYYKLRIIKPKKGKGSYVRSNYNNRTNND